MKSLRKIRKYLPSILFFSFIVWMIIQADLDKSNPLMKLGRTVPFGDKIGHFILFGTMALLLNVAIKFKRIHVWRHEFYLGSIIVLCFATIEEFSQLAFQSRTFDIVDMIFDLIGIITLSSVAFRTIIIRMMDGLKPEHYEK
ncbi:VanZ family protein [Ekhidna sp.]